MIERLGRVSAVAQSVIATVSSPVVSTALGGGPLRLLDRRAWCHGGIKIRHRPIVLRGRWQARGLVAWRLRRKCLLIFLRRRRRLILCHLILRRLTGCRRSLHVRARPPRMRALQQFLQLFVIDLRRFAGRNAISIGNRFCIWALRQLLSIWRQFQEGRVLRLLCIRARPQFYCSLRQQHHQLFAVPQ